MIFHTVFNGFESHLEAIWCHLGAILSQLGVQKGAGPELRSPPPPKKQNMARTVSVLAGLGVVSGGLGVVWGWSDRGLVVVWGGLGVVWGGLG